ncbi:MAG: hypothetical protein AB8B85_10745 [Paracoccaceae bacterium]
MTVRFGRILAISALAGGLGAVSAPQAQAQMVCGERDSIIAQLQKKYGETRRSVGLQQGRGVVEIYASAETGSWTILVTDTRGKSCLMAAGEAFQIEQIATAETPT